MKKYIAEVIGTFFLVFCCAGSNVINDLTQGAITHVGKSLTCGMAVLSMIYALGDISGAHLNPAVTLGFTLARRMHIKEAVYYIIAQFVGGLLAAITLRVLFPTHTLLGGTYPSASAMQSFTLEVILTFFLMFLILNVSRGDKEKGITAGIAIGTMVALEVLVGGPISGASMNPIRSLAPALVTGNLHAQWIYLTAPLIGAVLSVAVYNGLQAEPTSKRSIK